ncbi:hypothetical protein Tco_0411429 [Tanacetum coccineum]
MVSDQRGTTLFPLGSSMLFLIVPSCCVIFDLDPLSLSFDFVFNPEIVKSFPGVVLVHAVMNSTLLWFSIVGSYAIDLCPLPCSRYRFKDPVYLQGFLARSVRSISADALDSSY